MTWIRPNTITGAVAQGKKYFRRGDIEEKIWYELSQGNSVLFLAPRRVGKSSIVSHMAENSLEGLTCKYEDIESDASIQDFYQRMVRMIQDSLTDYGKTKGWFLKWWKSWSIKSIGRDKLEKEVIAINYKELFYELLKALKENDEKVDTQ